MMQGTVRHVDLKAFVGLSVSKIEISEFGVTLVFKHTKLLDIPTHWELVDTKTNAVLDRGLSIKLREQFLLLRIIHKRLLSFAKLQYQVDLFFDEDLRLTVF